MNEQECLSKMIAPGQKRPSKPYRGGVIQVHLTRACDKSCFHCTQGSNLGGRLEFMSLDNVEIALNSLKGYWGVVGIFGGNPALHPQFEAVCGLMRSYFPQEQCGLWCNNPMTESKAKAMQKTFNPSVSNLNVHMDPEAWRRFREWWPESRPFGLDKDSRHSPCYVAMKDVLKKDCPECLGIGRDPGYYDVSDCRDCGGTGTIYDEGEAWRLISNCDINKNWSAMIGQFRGQARAWFCEIAGAQAMLHQDDPAYPDTGLTMNNDGLVQGQYDTYQWWRLGMDWFAGQVRKHCHECSVPLQGYGELANACEDAELSAGHPVGKEQVSVTHQAIYKPKRKGRSVELVVLRSQLDEGKIEQMTRYLQNASK